MVNQGQERVIPQTDYLAAVLGWYSRPAHRRILVIADFIQGQENAAVAPATLNTVAAAAKIGGDIHVLVAGAGVGAVAEAAAKIAGVAKVLVADNAAYAHQLPENQQGRRSADLPGGRLRPGG